MAAEVGAEAPAIYIPFHVYSREDIDDNHKMMYGLIFALCYAKGYCDVSDDHIANALGISTDIAKRDIKTLICNGMLEDIGKNGERKLLPRGSVQ